jgi:hypothetical protein
MVTEFTKSTDDHMDVGDRIPTVGALGDAGSGYREKAMTIKLDTKLIITVI